MGCTQGGKMKQALLDLALSCILIAAGVSLMLAYFDCLTYWRETTMQQKINEQFNDIHAQAQAARNHAVYCEENGHDKQSTQHWHNIADKLFEAVELFDAMTIKSARMR